MSARKAIPKRICANPNCDNVVVLPKGRYGHHKKFCCKKCATRTNSRNYYARLSTPEKQALYEAGKDKALIRSRRWREGKPDLVLERHWKKKGIDMTLDRYEQLYARQGGACAICRRPYPMIGQGQLGIDHCHATGKVRGILCVRCNTALGTFGDTIEGVEAALRYLQQAI